MRLRFSDFVFLVILFSYIQFGISDRVSGSKPEAYVTLLYGDEFLLGVRVLGKSIRDTGSTKDMVVLVSDGVSDYAKKLLEADGWIVQTISLLANPNQVRPTRFWGVYTKLKIFNLTNYKKVVYLDADTIVVKSIEDLFKCSKFCANLKHSERLNSGVMVVEPSETVFNDMMNQVNTLPSYTGGDQGFLNSYFPGFANAHVFEPNLSSDVMNSRPVEMERLSTLYNADVGLYMLANKWMVDEKELRVVHYTLGPLKPWDWWTAWLLKPVDLWQNVREQLEESLPGTGGGRNPKDSILVKFLFLLPLFALVFFYYRSFLQLQKDFFGVPCRSSLCDRLRQLYYKYRAGGGLSYSTVGVSSSSIIESNQKFSNGIQSKVPAYLVGVSVFICFISAVVSLALALVVVPRQVMPWTGLLLLYEWTFTIFFILFGSYLHLIYLWGKMTAAQAGSYPAHHESSDYDYGKGHQRRASTCDVATWYYGLGMALLAVAAPSLPCLLGITALFVRLGLMVVGGLVLASFMTYASERLAIKAFLRGLDDRDLPRTRSSCFC
ncbi:inositol phosphorylceramide glucuronosyltransferase 1-like isoform X1 [Telopea speciosissima]|uniref:inositol phosphorylceramide glucuronosyltransferase 1-like isoform X1 n=1 Tax=Telopea speciosissima TaxID=54955 RepID=UPI001CC66309|nr:inositol phosphorylceramide glucuronosyltransferase 1-like isoform X1 [Telopea speciosissima]